MSDPKANLKAPFTRTQERESPETAAAMAAMWELARRTQQLAGTLDIIATILSSGVSSLLAAVGDSVIVEVSDTSEEGDGRTIEGEAEENEADSYE